MRFDRVVGLFVLTTFGAAGISAPATLPQGAEPRTDHADRVRLAESILRGVEQVTGRAFDPAFRRKALDWLAGLEVEDLAVRESRAPSRGIGPLAPGDSSAQLVYTPVVPCRIADTRVAGGPLVPGVPRDFRVTGGGLDAQGGEAEGCNVPRGPATAAMLNFVAVSPGGAGNLRAWAYRTPPSDAPRASILNYALVSGAGLNIANGIAVPICDLSEAGQTCPFDLRVRADGNPTHLVVDVVGYFERFPTEMMRSIFAFAQSDTQTTIPAACTHIPGLSATITAPVHGRVVVRSNLSARIEHARGFDENMITYIGMSPTECESIYSAWGLNDLVPTANFNLMLPLEVSFAVSPGTYTFYANARTSGQSPLVNDFVNFNGSWSTLEATFFPD